MAAPLPTNRAPFSLAEVLAATGGTLVREPRSDGKGAPPPAAVGVSTDSRALTAGQVFVALVGARFDGHDHLQAAARARAAVVIVSRDVEVPPGPAIVRVADTVRALGDLARAHRRRWARGRRGGLPRKLVAITGSAGKTTTRRASAALLAAAGLRVHSTSHNFNNQIGIPLTLLGLDESHDVAVIEIGTNSRGEIAAGAAIAEPDVGVLTLVAEAHTEGLGNAWDIMVEKGDLLAALPEDGIAIVNGDDHRAAGQLVRSPARTWIRYGEDPACDVALVARELRGASGQHLTVRVLGVQPIVRPLLEVDVAILGRAGVGAALAAIAVADAVLPHGAPAGDLASAALGAASSREPGRMFPRPRADGGLVIDDAYNANPASMLASIEAARDLARSEGRGLVLVLGEMYELGELATALHDEVARAAALVHPRALVAVKGLASRYHDAAKRYGVPSELVADADGALAAARRVAQPGDVILVKASNGVGLGRVADGLADGPPDPAGKAGGAAS